jgi:DNA-binding NarL/FixJ family response regulator
VSEPIRVLIADDQALLRDSFRILLETADDFAVVGEAATGREAVRIAAEEQPDVVLMDIRMPDMTGIEATEAICAAQGDARVLILTTFDLDEYVYGALKAGASGFLLKDVGAAALLAGLRVVAAGEALFAPAVTQRLIAAFGARPRPSRELSRVLKGTTDREREILTLIARGLSNAEIAAHLTLGPATVKSHIGRLLAKLHARDRAQLVVVAYESGLVTPAEQGGT